ncbi:hypothetical protein [Deinococcus altitudinis]|uniref:hypothetical protein n=1 Tax=Deinococcus altitudinis TaxID=468914 RepID=UPI003892020C
MKSAFPKLALVLSLLLTACSRPDGATTEDVHKLAARVSALEAQVTSMRQAQSSVATDAGAQQATARAAAQYCATQLASALEEYRQDNGRYPAVKAVTLPSPCQGFRVAWTNLEQTHYRFQVSGQTGAVLASEVR